MHYLEGGLPFKYLSFLNEICRVYRACKLGRAWQLPIRKANILWGYDFICQQNKKILQLGPLIITLKCHENLIVVTNNCYKRAIMKQRTEPRNSSTGNKYWYKSSGSFIPSKMCKLISLPLLFAKMVGWSTTKNRFQWSGCQSGKGTFRRFTRLGTQSRLLYPIIWHDNIVATCRQCIFS